MPQTISFFNETQAVEIESNLSVNFIIEDGHCRNIKARVTDGDVEGLIPAKNLAQVELLYNAGARDSPQYGMTSLLEARGAGLTSVALVSKMLSVMNVKVSDLVKT